MFFYISENVIEEFEKYPDNKTKTLVEFLLYKRKGYIYIFTFSPTKMAIAHWKIICVMAYLSIIANILYRWLINNVVRLCKSLVVM